MYFSKKFREISTVISFVVVLVFSLFRVWEFITETNIRGEQDFSDFEQVMVKRIVDGDTIVLADDRRVRYIGVDTPETVHPRKEVECFGKEASDFNRSLVENKIVHLEADVRDTDRYGRLLRYVWVNGEMVNEKLVREGYAFASAFPPDVKYQDLFNKAQQEAMSLNKGLWGECEINPVEEINQVIEQTDQALMKAAEHTLEPVMNPALIQ